MKKKSKQSNQKLRIILKSKNEEIFLGFDSDDEAVVLKDYQVIVEELFQKQEETIEKFDKNPIDDH